MIKASTCGKGRANLQTAMSERLDFKTSGALSGETGRPSSLTGRLDGVDLDKFREDQHAIVFTVYSYGTPIGWVTSDGEVYRVAQRFSVTTSKHQGLLYML